MRLLLTLCALGAPAIAQDEAPPAAPAPETPAEATPADAPPPCEARDPTTAEVNSREAVRLAKEGRYEEAAALFRIAVRLDECAPDHQLLLARSLARSGKVNGARHGYATVLERFPGSPEAERAQKELDELEAAPPPKEPDPVVDPPPKDPAQNQVRETTRPPPDGPPWDIIGYSTAGAGVLLLGAGVFFALDAQDAHDALEGGEDDKGRYDELVDQRDNSTSLSYVLYGVGVAAIGAGAVMAFVLHEPTPAPKTGDTLALVPTAGGAAVMVRGSF